MNQQQHIKKESEDLYTANPSFERMNHSNEEMNFSADMFSTKENILYTCETLSYKTGGQIAYFGKCTTLHISLLAILNVFDKSGN